MSAVVQGLLFIHFMSPERQANVTRNVTRSSLIVELYAALMVFVIPEGRDSEGPRAEITEIQT